MCASCPSSPGSEALTLASKELAMSASGKSRSNPTPSPSSIATGPTSPSSETCEPSTPQASQMPTYGAEGGHAKTLAAPGTAPAYPASVRDCGGRYCEPFAWYDPDSSSWKTWSRSLTGQWETFSGRWPRSGMTRSGIAYLRRPLAPLISVIVSGCWLPTPTRSMGKRGWGFSLTTRKRYSRTKIETAHRYGWRPPVCLLEWAMGFPVGWTDASALKSSATAPARKSSKRSRAGSGL